MCACDLITDQANIGALLSGSSFFGVYVDNTFLLMLLFGRSLFRNIGLSRPIHQICRIIHATALIASLRAVTMYSFFR